MPDWVWIGIVLLPNLLVAAWVSERASSGLYVLYSWIAAAGLYGGLGLAYFLGYVLLICLIAILFRHRLRLGAFFRGH